MFIDTERGYRAVASRDPRFDGQFILAVRTTGIYCRPSCPATTPKRRNVEFYATAAAAQAAGYRACRRCLPDAVPGSPEWNLRADLAGRAMRLISDGIVEREGVPGLATRLGYSERHVTRMLTAELGASPLALARAHRAHSARLLIETTTLSFADVAFAAGFASIRQFNDTIRAVFAATPTQLRIGAKRHRPLTTAGKVNLRLAFRQPFDGTGVVDFLKARAVTGVEDTDGGYARTLRLPHGTGTARMYPAPDHVDCTLRLSDMRDLGSAVARLRRLFDLDADPCAVDELLTKDPALEPWVLKTPGIRVPGSVDGPEIVLRALIGQQITVAAARTALTRLTDALGERLEAPDGTLTTLFPTPAAIAEHGAEVLTGPRKRIETIRTVSAAIASGDLDVHVGADPDELAVRLEAFSGIGPWTSGYVKMRVLGAPDILLPGDVALRKGAEKLGITDLAARSTAWAPWRSYAGMHLWRADLRTS
ncbi:AraC family transcriptional regulator [Actinosynnema sp. ALI-1.44]|uniref:AlkA N-terminal domain-containing protein n=1 Tax=Actinosynnema sp. ALI-1.44 TaxID=1933779 RepID=UPI00097BD285|nr:AlkA N-terminal domain-containing protein [Actinosynnema sp. ALI-1.44]ONI77129.1 AraC family transcriptional regulator [Actinosynnema sp. ALI-1.44]